MITKNERTAVGIVVALIVLGCSALSGCDDDASKGNQDATTAGDGSSDIETPDTTPGDAATDVGLDGNVADTSDVVDTSGAEDASDVVDTSSTDTSAADTTDVGVDTADVTAEEGCAAGYARFLGLTTSIVGCAGTTEALNQCDAAQACGAGWHVCSASEYQAVYGTEFHTETENSTFWLASCIRDGADAQAPTDAVCSDCSGTQTGSSIELAWSCVNSISIESDQLYVGVRAGSACTRTGVDDAANEAFWNAQPAGTTQKGAFCCQ